MLALAIAPLSAKPAKARKAVWLSGLAKIGVNDAELCVHLWAGLATYEG